MSSIKKMNQDLDTKYNSQFVADDEFTVKLQEILDVINTKANNNDLTSIQLTLDNKLSKSGGTITGDLVTKGTSNWLGKWRISSEWIGLYSTIVDTSSTRKGWIGWDGGTNLNIVNEAGGNINLSNSNVAIAKNLTVSGITYVDQICAKSKTSQCLITYSTDGNVVVGSVNNTGATNIYAPISNMINLSIGDTTVTLSRENSTQYYLRPATSDLWGLGSGSYRWKNVVGVTANFTNSITVKGSTVSDIRYKENINYDIVDESKKLIYSLKPASYNFNIDSVDKSKTYGLIAQDVKEYLIKNNINELSCGLSMYKKEEYENEDFELNLDTDEEKINYSLDYSQYIAPLIAVVQEQKKEIDELKEIVNNYINVA